MIDIYYKSYAKDFPLLKYSLQSLLKNVQGYNKIIISIPVQDYKRLDETIGLEFFLQKPQIVGHIEEGNGYLYQQYCKISAHIQSEGKYILFADSDVIFDIPIDLNDYINTGKPEILYTNYSEVGDAICWKEPTEKFIGQPIDFEFMRRIPLIYHRSTLENIHKANPNLKEYIMNSGRFSEFNAIGAWSFINEPDKYNFVNTANWQYTRPMATQLWSWANKDGDELHKREYQRSLDTINKALNLNLTEL